MNLQDLEAVPTYATAHGLEMGLAFVVVFPLGAFLIRALKLKANIWAHVAVQSVGWILMIAGLATGIRLGKILGRLHNNAHTILGTVVVVLMILQPFFGVIHHRWFLRTRKRTRWASLHVWYGRLLIVLGIINGGLGLQLAANTRAGEIAYGVIGGVVGLAYVLSVMWREVETKSSGAEIAGDGEELAQPSEH